MLEEMVMQRLVSFNRTILELKFLIGVVIRGCKTLLIVQYLN